MKLVNIADLNKIEHMVSNDHVNVVKFGEILTGSADDNPELSLRNKGSVETGRQLPH